MNKEKLITIIFPSRGRYDLVKKLLLSIEEKTYNKDWNVGKKKKIFNQ